MPSVLDEIEVFESRGMQILKCNSVLMLDWDINQSKRREGYYQTPSINSRDDIQDILTRGKNDCGLRNIGIRLYYTPNGVRGFLTSQKLVIHKAENIHLAFGVDRGYRVMTQEIGAYNVRVSPKPERKEDYVAQFWFQFGNPIINPEILQYLKVHDSLCKQYRNAPPPFNTGTTLEAIMKSKAEEPWEQVNKNALSDLLEELDIMF